MKYHLLNLESQIPVALAVGKSVALPAGYRNFSNVLICGMGGSGMSGDILRSLAAERSPLPFEVHRSGHLPQWVSRETLAIFTSYSGNTQETLDCFGQAVRAGARILAVTSGGNLADLSRRKKIPVLRIPSGIPPRCAIGYLTFSLLPILKKTARLDVPVHEINEAIQEIRGVSRTAARILAHKIHGRAVHLYAVSGTTEPAALRWRAQFAENAKTLASHHVIPEMFHNEIEGWNFPHPLIKRSAAIFFTDRGEPAWLRKKRRFAQKLIRRHGAMVLEVSSHGKTPLGRIFSLVALGDWISYELALLNGVDPLAVPSLEAIKKIK